MTTTRTRRHGTRPCYQQGPVPGWPAPCRCTPCRRANARAERRRRGGVAFVDAAPVRTHLRTLEGGGIGSRQVATTAGVSRETVRHLRDGRRRRCRADVAARILGAYPTRWPLDPLLGALGRPTKATAALRLGVTVHQLQRWESEGLGIDAADRAATAIDSHPALIWAGW